MKNNPTTFGEELIEGMKETLEFIKGNSVSGKAYFVYGNHVICIQDIREKLGMTREEFAKNFLFKLNTVRNWEQGTRHPNGHTLAYLTLIASDPIGTHKTLKPITHNTALPA